MRETPELAGLASSNKKHRANTARCRFIITAHYLILVNVCEGRACQSGKFWRLYLSCISRYGWHMKTPQQLSREAIAEFKAIYQEEFGETLSDDEVQEIAMRLLRFFGILYPSNEPLV